jgi:tetratricopeptide (TPR) repeat protein
MNKIPLFLSFKLTKLLNVMKKFRSIPVTMGLTLVVIAVVLGIVWLYSGNNANNVAKVTPVANNQTSLLDRQIATVQKNIQAKPDNAANYAQLGLAYLQKVREVADPSYYARADAALQKALELDAKNHDAIGGMGTLQLARHNFAQGLEWGMKGANLYPTSAFHYGVMGDALIELGRYDEAVKAIQRMVDLRPDLSSYSRVSYIRELLGNYNGAVEAMKQAVSAGGATPENQAWVIYQLGNLYFSHNDLTNAETTYQSALAVFPNFVYARAGLARVRAAFGDTEGALNIYKQITTQMPLPEFLIEYGDLLAVNGRKSEAANQYEVVRAIQKLYRDNGVDTDLELVLFSADRCEGDACKDPQLLATARNQMERHPSIKAADTLAWVLYQAGDYQAARKYSQEALRLNTQDSLLFFHAGMIAFKLGDTAEARHYLDKALQLNPNFSYLYAPVARQTLKQ